LLPSVTWIVCARDLQGPACSHRAGDLIVPRNASGDESAITLSVPLASTPGTIP